MSDICELFKCIPNIRCEMLSADYWIEKSSNAYELHMNCEQIHKFNIDNIRKPERNNTLYNLAGFSDIYKYGVCVRRSIIWQTSDFENPLTAIYVNEPVVVLEERKNSYKICCVYYEGWINKKSIAVCEEKEQWLKYIYPDKFITVLADYINLPYRVADCEYEMEISGLRLDMGVKLAIAAANGIEGMYYNYIVNVPVRDTNGSLVYIKTGIPVSADVMYGYIPYTGANVLRQAFKTLGNTYGWGGTLYSRDCSALVMDIHRCFGIILPRDVSGQSKLCKDYVFCKSKLNIGDILGFPGHTMIYAGYDCDSGKHYVISEMGSFYTFDESGGTKRNIVDSCVLSDLSLKRKNGNTWEKSISYAGLDSLTK